MEVRRFHVVVIGSGPAGSSAAIRLAKAGLSVAIIDEREYGGTCPNRGCDPKKLLRVGAEIAHRSKALASQGIVEPAQVHWDRLMRFKRELTKRVPAEVERSLASAGVTPFHGTARFVEPKMLRVGTEGLVAERFIIATGSKPRELSFEGADLLATSEDVLDFDELPEHALFIGGGYVSFELAHILNALGVVCTIIHEDEDPLPEFDRALIRMLIESSREDGIEIVLGSRVVGVESIENSYHVHATSNEEHHTYETDVAINGAGREANTAQLDCHIAGIHLDQGAIVVDGYLRANEYTYAIGDCSNRGANLTPLAQLHGRNVTETLLGRPTICYDEIVPRVLFTLPELAMVGLNAEQARASGIDIDIENHETSSWFSSKRIGQRHAGARIIIDRSTDLIIGAHLFGEASQELIHLFALAMREGISRSSLKNLVYAFPTHSSDISSLL
jgi:glutathione reductase (NADPH)